MLPLLRVLLPGGFLIVTLGLVAGFAAPAGSRAQFMHVAPLARGPLIAQDEHPEWKQFLMQAAVRRAREVEQLRDLPGQEATAGAAASEKTAGLHTPADQIQPEDRTDSISDAVVNDVIPIDIGETSSTELPIAPPQTVPAIEKLQRLQWPDETAGQPAIDPAPAAAKPRIVKPAAGKPRGKRKPAGPVKTEETTPLLSQYGSIAMP